MAELAEAKEEARPEGLGEEGPQDAGAKDEARATVARRKSGRGAQRSRVNWLMHLLYTRGEYSECLRLVESQLRMMDGMCEYAVRVKGLVLREQGRVQEALELFQAATLLNPHNPENLKQIGKSLYLLGKHRGAIDVLDESALQAAHEDWEVKHNQGLCYLFLDELDKAVECFEEANSVQRQDRTFIEMGKIFTVQNKLDRAIEVFLEALEFSPENPELLTTVGLLYMRQGDNFKAFDYLGNSLTHDPRCPKTILAAGSIIQDHGDMDVALVKYRVAAVKTPNSAQLWNNVGMCFFGKQRYVAAVACLKRSMYLDPFQWITAHNLGVVFLNTGQYASAFHYLSASINLKPDYAASYTHLAVALTRLDDAENALAAYHKALKLDPADPICVLNLAVALANAGGTANAEESLRRFKEYEALREALDPEERKALLESCHELEAAMADLHGDDNRE